MIGSTTHQTCSNRLDKEGGKAQCCNCVPHNNCNLYPKSEFSEMVRSNGKVKKKLMEEVADRSEINYQKTLNNI